MKRTIAFALSFVVSMGFSFLSPASAGDWTTKVDGSVLQAATSGTTEFLAYMDERPDLSGAAALGTKAEKGRHVYEVLTTTAARSQAGLLSHLAMLGASHRPYWIANAVHASGDLSVLQAVASRPDVAFVYPVGRGRVDPPIAETPGGTTATELATAAEPSLGHVRATDAWSLGYRGQGVVVAGADTGVRYTHSAIKRQYRGYDAATNTWDHSYNWHDAIPVSNLLCPAHGTTPCDDHDHGTHTVGTIVGDDGAANQIGMAPEAKWVACRNMVEGFGVVPTYMECMQWLLAPTDSNGRNPDPAKAPDVVNNSWGCVEGCASPLLKDMVDASRAAGIVYVVSAGNEGRAGACATIAFPLAVYDSSFTVGATNATNDGISSFSSRGPVMTNAVEGVAMQKPDIVAPGVNIRSATRGSDTSYGVFSGTSMAGPHVAGLVALIISANPDLRGQVSAIEDVITRTAKKLIATDACGAISPQQVPNYTFGWGRIDALAAVQRAVELRAIGTEATGGGWLASVEGDKVNFAFEAENEASGPAGELKLNDHRARVKIQMTSLTKVAPLREACGDVSASASSVEISGSGTINGASATFRACVQDNGRKVGKTPPPDRFHLECVSGCTYRTSGRVADAVIDAGNIDVEVPSSAQTTDGAGSPSTMTLSVSGQTLSVRVFDALQQPITNASISIVTLSGGVAATTTALTDAAGSAIVLVSGLAGAEYQAISGLAESNSVFIGE